jgi:hypothetical protein
MFMMVKTSVEGAFWQAEQFIVNAFDPNLTMSAAEVALKIIRHTDHLDTRVATTESTLPHVAPF